MGKYRQQNNFDVLSHSERVAIPNPSTFLNPLNNNPKIQSQNTQHLA